MQDIWNYAGQQLGQVIYALLPLPVFILLALATKGRSVIADIRNYAPESKIAVLMLTLDAALVAPVLVLISLAMAGIVQQFGPTHALAAIWLAAPPAVVALLAVFLGDMIGYWRHRLEHTTLLWPSHAIHHSDTAMTWLAIFRFHPFNRLSTFIIDATILMALGLPPYAILVNGLVRHYYGAFIHADLPWTYGKIFGKIFVSPAMHRWHHALDPAAFNTNFTTVFSFIDLMFGTRRVPGPCDIALGVSDDMAPGFMGQVLHPLKPSSYAPYRNWRRKVGQGKAAVQRRRPG
ncbi:sterol desaturase family protein [Devosia rhodophyticola]|uniref:Sterol desaturase family protein n=1 Tax=Devosia rhodophyticola TaxID=3026423 RepID=A0ABY7YXK6_9HYPH|nr:sterol desaturase family protein [Devosia rhodophyticola]WDR05986.1 sterol desaturase family protein [Devosia rhodophyticola]